MKSTNHSRYRVALVLVGIVLGAGTVLARGADLTAAEKQNFDLAKKDLAQLQTNLKLARDAAGPGEDTPPASKAKLAAARLQSARQSAANVAARLEKLPADNADVKTLQADYDETMKSVDALNDRITGKNAKPKEQPKSSTDKPADAPAPAANEQPLDFRARESLKLAQNNVEQVDAFANSIEKSIAEFNATKDKTSIAAEAVQGVVTRIGEARRRVGFANDQFKKLPPDHSSVKAAAADLKAAVARIDASEKALDPVLKQVAKNTDPGADFKVDCDRLKELREMLLVGNLQHDRAKVAEVVKQLPGLKAEHERLRQKYAALLKQNTGESEQLKRNGQQLDYTVGEFEKKLEQEKIQLPQQFDADLAQIEKLADTAVKENRPAYFKGGIADNFRYAADKLVLYEALDPAGAKAAADKLAAAKEKVKQQEASLAESIIAGNDLPPDTYTGADKADLVSRATDAIKKQNPAAQVLAVRIPSSQWDHERMWRNQNREWYLIDRSKLQAQVITKRDAKIAEIHPVNLWKDHVNADKISAFPLFEAKEELSPQSLMLAEKVK
jgi:hypothetical protein